ncbi:MAG: hypothetical protein JWN10_2156 [Solirubrobacterales bacterium]|nr:hypothetical protein [Solirubrobacterales bacterium]
MLGLRNVRVLVSTDTRWFKLIKLRADKGRSMRKPDRSDMATAAKPKTVTVGAGADEADSKGVAAVIPVGEFQKARREPKWLAFRKAAIAEREQLRRQGHSS